MERVILTTGGTGGHIFPALAVAEEIRRRRPETMVLFMGGRYGQEADLAVKAGLDFIGLPVRGVMGRGLRGIGAAFGIARGIFAALRVMRRFRPSVVVGFGGYAAFAGVAAARVAGIPTAIHEQNALPGAANKLLGRIVDRVFLSMPDDAGAFPAEKCLLAGNPVRADIAALYEAVEAAAQEKASGKSWYGGVDGPSPFDAGKQPAPDGTVEEAVGEPAEARPPAGRGPRLLVIGGSLGARAINDGMTAAVDALREAGVVIRHQTGKADYERTRAAYREAGAGQVRVEPFITDMAGAYAGADLVLARAGASSLAEITTAGLPAVLVPYPFAARDHQRLNARSMESRGAAIVLEQDLFYGAKADKNILPETLLGLLKDEERLRSMREKSRELARPHAAKMLVDALEELTESRQLGTEGTPPPQTPPAGD